MTSTLCFTCGQPITAPPRLNTLSSGEICPSCSRRVLETLPPLLPRWAIAGEDLEGIADSPPADRPVPPPEESA